MSRPTSLSKSELFELLNILSERLRRNRATAKIYIIGGACMALAYGRGRTTEDVDARIDAGHSALINAVHEIAHERNLPQSWLNEQATTAIPRGRDRCARTLYESSALLVTGASPENLLAMKLEAGRDKDIEDISHLLEVLEIDASDKALAIHDTVLPGSTRRAQARGLLSALALERTTLAPPTTPLNEQRWLDMLASDGPPLYECKETPNGLTLTVQTDENEPKQVLGHGLTLQGLALMECGHRGWPTEAIGIIKGFTATQLARPRERS